jgi:coproporphyrinogen III oxidase-like Fe-S oxidoreductase
VSTGHDPDTLASKLSRCKEGMAQFLQFGYNFYEDYACRGTSLISETDLSRCNKCYKMGTSAVSRYNFDRSQKTVTMQDYYYGHWSGVGIQLYKGHDIESRKCKNCDKFMNYIVRVSVVVLALTKQMLLRHKAF